MEADTSVTGNVIDSAPSAGIAIGWHRWMRNVAATGNIIRKSGIGIAVSGDQLAGSAVIANNVIAEARQGAIRTMRGDQPFGPDLVTFPTSATPNMKLTGNVVS